MTIPSTDYRNVTFKGIPAGQTSVRGFPELTPYAEPVTGWKGKAKTAEARAKVDSANQFAVDRFVSYAARHVGARADGTLPGDKFLVQAAENRTYLGIQGSYSNPAEYIRDLWKDGHIGNGQAGELVEELQGNKKAGAKVQAFLEQELSKGHISQSESQAMWLYEQPAPEEKSAAQNAALRGRILKQLEATGVSDPKVALAIAVAFPDSQGATESQRQISASVEGTVSATPAAGEPTFDRAALSNTTRTWANSDAAAPARASELTGHVANIKRRPLGAYIDF